MHTRATITHTHSHRIQVSDLTHISYYSYIISLIYSYITHLIQTCAMKHTRTRAALQAQRVCINTNNTQTFTHHSSHSRIIHITHTQIIHTHSHFIHVSLIHHLIQMPLLLFKYHASHSHIAHLIHASLIHHLIHVSQGQTLLYRHRGV